MLRCIVAFLAIVTAAAPVSRAQDVGIRAPEGFEVTLFAGDKLAHNIYSMTIDPRGNIVVAGPDYVKTLHDRDGDGQADEAEMFSPVPRSGAHGMVFLGNDLLCTGDNSVMLLRDSDGDGIADGEAETWAYLRHPEHGANGLAHGPDGSVYLICGNDTGVTQEHATTAGSPVKQPRCGAVVRFSPHGGRTEVIAHGFRNPYDLAFNEFGHVFTVDADGERDQHLPWYSPTRLFDIAQGRHHGWVLKGWRRAWNRPPWFFDNVKRLSEIGRGSPTGVAVYRHRQFPQRYRGGAMSCCWTLGRVYHFPLQRDGSSYKTSKEIFLETTGDVGFAPVDLAVGPEGDLFVAIGGRRTRGSVFRVHYTAGVDEATSGFPSMLEQVLSAPQPLAAWSRRDWEPLARDLGSGSFDQACLDDSLSVPQRIRAIEILTDLFNGLDAEIARKICKSNEPELLARVAWSLGRRPQGKAGNELLVKLTRRGDPRVKRATWEALQTRTLSPELAERIEWHDVGGHAERRVRSAAALAYTRQPTGGGEPLAAETVDELLAQAAVKHLGGELAIEQFDNAVAAYVAAATDQQRLIAVRLMQLTLGDILSSSDRPDVFAGYAANNSEAVDSLSKSAMYPLLSTFPTDSREVNIELARLFAMIGVHDREAVTKIATLPTESSHVTDDLHYLMALARLPAARAPGTTRRIAAALVGLHHKMEQDERYPSRNWPTRVAEAFIQLCRFDPALPAVLLSHSEFGLPGHALFVTHLSTEYQTLGARKLIARVNELDEDAWTPKLVDVAAMLPADEALPLLREQWRDFRLRAAILQVLASNPRERDRGRFIEALGSPQPNVVEQAARALSSLQPLEAEELTQVMLALRQYCTAPQYTSVRAALSDLLRTSTGQMIHVEEKGDLLASYQPWFDWFRKTHPKAAKELRSFAGDDAETWYTRLQEISWGSGDASRGKKIFEKQACHRCHSGRARLGPELSNAAGRFSREDLFAAIIDPNKDVSPLYQTTQILTGSGKIYHGLVVYESPDGTLLQTTPDQTIRIAGDEIVSMQKSKRSLMPVGLLKGLDDADLADLYAYLRSLQPST